MVPVLLILTILFASITFFAWRATRISYEEIPWNFDLDKAIILDDRKLATPPIRMNLSLKMVREMYLKNSYDVTVAGTATRKPGVTAALSQGVDIEVELVTTAFETSPEPRQRVFVPGLGFSADARSYIEPLRWSVTPKMSGSQPHSFSVRAVWLDDHGNRYEIDRKTCAIIVFERARLNAAQIQLITWLGAILTLLSIVITAAATVGALFR